MAAPKLFISYSWSSPEHEKWVVDLATELRTAGVDVILDKWELKEGHDAVAFMEQMVTNQDIKKVAIICDEKYASKADNRSGGVGTETQIISKEVYERQDQNKFVAVVNRKDENGRPFLPTYYKSRIYIDLSEADGYTDSFERLLRWIFDKPLYLKPEIGTAPAFLEEGEHLSLGTSLLFKRCLDALKNHKGFAEGAFDEYCSTFTTNFDRFRIVKPVPEFDEAVVASIDEFLPYRNEMLQLFMAIGQYRPSEENIQRLHKLFEDLIPYMHRPLENLSPWQESDFDNFRFLIHELFLYCVAFLVKYERFNQASVLLQQQYYVPLYSNYGKDAMVNFESIHQGIRSLLYRNQRMNSKRLSIRSDLLKNRSSGTGIDFSLIMQADFIAFMRAELSTKDAYSWWPETLLHLGHFRSAFEVFARSASKSYFDKTKVLLGIGSPSDLELLLGTYESGSRSLPRWEFDGFNPRSLLGFERLATRP